MSIPSVRLPGRINLALAVTLSLAICPAASLLAQQQGVPPLPRQQYYAVFGDLYGGEYQDAARGLRTLSKSAFRDGDGYFLDSVCYWTMLGECYYRLGDYGAAIEQYEAALNLYAGLQAWPTRIGGTSPEILEDTGAARRAAVSWATSARTARYGKFDNAMLIRMGNTDAENEAAIRGGGVVDFQRLRKIDMAEIMRCVSLAAYRRYTIKGPTCKIDPFTKQLSISLVGNGGTTVTSAWQGVARGVALASIGDWANARTVLTNSLRIGGFDHPLTPIALLVLGHAAAEDMNFVEAQKLFLEASIAAAAYEQYDMIEESLHFAAVIHSAQRTGQPFDPVVQAAAWAKREKADPLQVSLMVDAAWISIEAGDTSTADAALNQARLAMRGNGIDESALQTRWLYTSALNLYVQRDLDSGDKAFSGFLKHAQGTSRWLYQISLADAAVRGNNVTERDAELLYDALLNEPVEADWLFRPDEAMAFLATPHFGPMERWFTITLARKAEEKAIEIAELIRRQRFFSALPMGGRLVSLRWILEAPNESLSDSAQKQKQDLLIRYPVCKQLSDQVQAVQAELEKLPIDPEANSEERLQQKQLLDQLAQASAAQEMIIRQIALLREPCELAFPRPLSVPQIQQALKPNQVLVSFLRIGEIYHVMTLGSARYSIEGTVAARDLDRKILELLKRVGVGDKAAIYDSDELASDEWRSTAREISGMIFQKSDAQSMSAIEELIVIPDGKVWYLPMELLQHGSDQQSASLIDTVRIRYAPMAALGVPDQRTNRRFQRSAIVAFRNFNRDPDEIIDKGVSDMRDAMPQLARIARTFQGPSSLIESTLDQLFVWHDHKDRGSRREGPLDVSPMQLDEGKPGSTLMDWMALPWRGVDQLVWSGFSTDIEGSTRARADGSEMFFATTALMASGVRTMLLSRWRVGGRSTLDLTREFAIQLNRQPAAAAWQRSVQLFRRADLDLTVEPRVRPVELEQPLTGEAPFFWAGYMLIDGGGNPDPTALPAANVDDASAAPDSDAGKASDDG